MTATIRDVARLAGWAVSTVSLVVNNKGRVSKKTEAKVKQAVEQLDYHPQRSARGLVHSAAAILALFSPPTIFPGRTLLHQNLPRHRIRSPFL